MAREHFNPYYASWVETATCRTVGDAFYLPPDASHEDWDYVRSICLTRCPVVDPCRERVMRIELGQDHKTRFGVWAGMSPLERKAFEPEWIASQDGSAA